MQKEHFFFERCKKNTLKLCFLNVDIFGYILRSHSKLGLKPFFLFLLLVQNHFSIGRQHMDFIVNKIHSSITIISNILNLFIK